MVSVCDSKNLDVYHNCFGYYALIYQPSDFTADDVETGGFL